jgi:hypothetical protein
LKKKKRPHYLLRELLGFLEWISLSNNHSTNQPQVFVIGLPRTGTTLIYQYIVHRLAISYFTNGVGKYFKSPCLITYIQHKLYGNYQSDFISHYGKVAGPNAPREAGSFWGRFFGFDNYINYSEVDKKDVHTIRNTIACIQNIFGDVPFVNKNVKHMLRIDTLCGIFPKVHLVIVERDLEDVAISTLRSRYNNLSDPNKWWSVKPPNFDELKGLETFEQVGYQLISLQKKLSFDLSKIAHSRVIRLSYEEFCTNPDSIIEKITNVIDGMDYGNNPVKQFKFYSHNPQTSEEKDLVRLIRNANI